MADVGDVKLGGIFLEDEFPVGRRCKELIHDFGYEAYYAITLIWGALNKDVWLSRRSVLILVEPHLHDKSEAFIDWCVAESLLDIDGDHLYSERITKRKEKRLKDRARKRGGNDEESEWNSDGNDAENERNENGNSTESSRSLSNVYSPLSNVSKTEEGVQGERPKAGRLTEAEKEKYLEDGAKAVDEHVFPAPYDHDDVRIALIEWLDHRVTNHKFRYKSLKSFLKTTVKCAQTNRASRELLVFAINTAINRNWQGIQYNSAVMGEWNQAHPQPGQQSPRFQQPQVTHRAQPKPYVPPPIDDRPADPEAMKRAREMVKNLAGAKSMEAKCQTNG